MYKYIFIYIFISVYIINSFTGTSLFSCMRCKYVYMYIYIHISIYMLYTRIHHMDVTYRLTHIYQRERTIFVVSAINCFAEINFVQNQSFHFVVCSICFCVLLNLNKQSIRSFNILSTLYVFVCCTLHSKKEHHRGALRLGVIDVDVRVRWTECVSVQKVSAFSKHGNSIYSTCIYFYEYMDRHYLQITCKFDVYTLVTNKYVST